MFSINEFDGNPKPKPKKKKKHKTNKQKHMRTCFIHTKNINK